MPLLAPRPGPSTLKARRWGGARLAPLRGAAHDPTHPIGESWEFSTMPGSESRVEHGSLREALGADLPYLVKLIDTATALSVQVHPDDAPGRVGPDAGGKEEAWVILDAAADAEIPVGFRDGVTMDAVAEATDAAVADPERGDALLELLDAIPARPGTVILVPARTVHAIPGGVLLAEIQQPADCTLRLFDYGSSRPIQPREALATIDVSARPHVWQPGDTPGTLRGRHLRLTVVTADAPYLHDDDGPLLVVPVTGEARVACDGEQHALAPADLRLAVAARGGPRPQVSTSGIAVVGDLPGAELAD